MTIRFFVDSGADLPASIESPLPIVTVPLSVHFGDRVYKDGVDLSLSEFYRQLRDSPVPPNTSQPSPGEFLTAYTGNSDPGDTLFSFHLSSRLSGTYQSAVLAARQLTDRRVIVVDTGLASSGIAVPAILGGRWAAEGASVEEIQERSQQLIAGVRVFFLVDTLEYLQRNGRIGRAQALVGSLLNIKPVLTISDGYVAPADKVRGRARAQDRLLELLVQGATPEREYFAVVVESEGSEGADELTDRIRQAVPTVKEILRTALGATIGTHAGPGTIGAFLFALP